MEVTGYYINLGRSPARREYMEKQIAAQSLPILRLEAVDGRVMNDATYDRWQNDVPKMHHLSKEELGCFLSHRDAWQKIANGPCSFGAVFEDDVLFSQDAGMFLRDDAWLPSSADLVKIESVNKKVMLAEPYLTTPSQRQLARMVSTHLGTGGYIVSKGFAQALLDQARNADLPIDYFLFGPSALERRDTSMWQLYPAICVQQVRTRTVFLPNDAEDSGLANARGVVKRRGLTKLGRELARPFIKLIHELRQTFQALLSGRKWRKVKFRR